VPQKIDTTASTTSTGKLEIHFVHSVSAGGRKRKKVSNARTQLLK